MATVGISSTASSWMSVRRYPWVAPWSYDRDITNPNVQANAGSASPSSIRRCFVEFDLSSVPPEADVTSATVSYLVGNYTDPNWIETWTSTGRATDTDIAIWYSSATLLGRVKWATTGSPPAAFVFPDYLPTVKAAIAAGMDWYSLLWKFEDEPEDGRNASQDRIAGIKLTLEYTVPKARPDVGFCRMPYLDPGVIQILNL